MGAPINAVVTWSGDLDLAAVDAFTASAVDTLRRGGAAVLTLDMRGAGTVDSTGIAAIITVRSYAVDHNATVDLFVAPRLHRLLDIAGVLGLTGMCVRLEAQAPAA